MDVRQKLGLWSPWRLATLRIGVRLRVAFAAILCLLVLGSGVSIWNLSAIRAQIEGISRFEQQMTAILQLDNSVLTLMNRLRGAAETQEKGHFRSEASRLLAELQGDTAWAREALRGFAGGAGRQAVMLDSLNALFDALPARVNSLVELADAGDWIALHARLSDQVDHTDDVLAAVVQDIDRDLAQARKRMLEGVARTQWRTAQILFGTGLLSFMAAGLMGLVVTRSITRPLDSLAAGARALSEGRFGYKVTLTGSDELAELAAMFNAAATEIAVLYEKVRLSEAHFRSLIENASDLILTVSGTGNIAYVSPSSVRVLGYAPENLNGRPIGNLLMDQEEARCAALIRPAAAPSGTQSITFRVRHADGSVRTLEGLATNLLNDPAINGIVVNARDVTERLQAEDALREREEQLRQAQKMEAVGRLAGGVAHDFNNDLTVINGYSEFLLQTLDAQDPRYGYAKSIRAAGEHAAELTRQLLAFGRKQMLRPTVLSLSELIRETEGMLRRVIGEDVVLQSVLDPSIAHIEADRNQVHQVLMNLSANARDAMPHGGKLRIETKTVVLDEPLRHGEEKIPAGRYVVLEVSDTGQGMEDSIRRKIFEPFFTTKEFGKGTGLGLATVYGIVRQSGGHITVESAVDEGSTFRIYLPRVDELPAAGSDGEPGPAPAGHETILVVEDEAEVRNLAVTVLKSYGYKVIEAADASQALQLYNASSVPIHLLLTDVVMPGMNGVELSKRLRAINPELKIVFVSGYTDSVILRHGVPDEGVALLPKPYRPAALAGKIREALGPA